MIIVSSEQSKNCLFIEKPLAVILTYDTLIIIRLRQDPFQLQILLHTKIDNLVKT